MHDQDTFARAPAYSGAHEADDNGSKAAVAAETAKETAKDEARNVAGTAREEAGAVVGEARGQVRRIVSQAKDQATDRVNHQHNRLVDRLRGLADEFDEMGGDGDSPGKALVSDLGQRGRRVADYLADRGPEGIVSEVTDFARRRPFAFLAGAVAAGFLVGRLGKGVWKAQQEQSGGSTPAARPAAGPSTVLPADPYVAEAETVVTTPVVVEPVVADPHVVEAFPATPAAPVPPSNAPVTPAVPPEPYDDPRQGGVR
jgi:hypothetical protein